MKKIVNRFLVVVCVAVLGVFGTVSVAFASDGYTSEFTPFTLPEEVYDKDYIIVRHGNTEPYNWHLYIFENSIVTLNVLPENLNSNTPLHFSNIGSTYYRIYYLQADLGWQLGDVTNNGIWVTPPDPLLLCSTVDIYYEGDNSIVVFEKNADRFVEDKTFILKEFGFFMSGFFNSLSGSIVAIALFSLIILIAIIGHFYHLFSRRC